MRSAVLSDLLELSDSGVWGEDDPATGMSVLRSTNFRNDGTLIFENLTFRAIDSAKRSSKALAPGDLLLEKSGGGPSQPVGRVALFVGDERPHAFGNFIARLRPRRDVMSEYLWYFLRFFHALGKTSHYQKQTTGIRNLELRRYLAIHVPLRSLAEQRRIVDLLARAEGIVRLRREAQRKADELIPAIFIDMFGDPATNSRLWPVVPLGNLMKSGPSNGLYKHKSAYGRGTPILRIDGFYDGAVTGLAHLKRVQIDDENELRRFALVEGDIVVNRVNSPEYLGKSAIIPPLPEPTVFESNMMRFSVDETRALPEFAIALLQQPACRSHLLAKAKHAINQSSVNQQDVRSVPVPLPPLELQRRFAQNVKASASIRTQQADALAKAQSTFDALLSRAFA